MSRSSTRREFLRRSAIVGASAPFLAAGFPAIARAGFRQDSPNEKVRIASIGVGGKGDSDCSDAGHFGELVAICDVDRNTVDKKGEKFPNAKKYSDYRKLLEELGDKIDAVTVSTPDHTHAPASVMAMRMGKHCFCQKPLTWSIEEARLMRTLAREKNLCTQMGNQGTADGGFRTGVEVIRSGVLGTVKEVHAWTNRPIWPQGIPRPQGEDPVPETLNWDVWLGAAPVRPFKNGVYHTFNWRGWLDFGTGAIGDMACHTVNVACMGLRLFDAHTAEVIDTSGIVDHETYPTWSIMRSHFAEAPARGNLPARAPLTLTWYEGGGNLPEDKRAFKELLHGEKPGGSGLLIVGTEGSFYSVNDYGAEHVLLPKDKFKDSKKPEPTLPRAEHGHFGEWIDAIKKNEPRHPMSNFGYAGRLTETALLLNLALKVNQKIEWDAQAMKATNCPDADQYIRRNYRKGFSIHEA